MSPNASSHSETGEAQILDALAPGKAWSRVGIPEFQREARAKG